jgi:hypothetical protein
MSLPEDSKSSETRINFQTESLIHFEVQGRLGNQLFCLSDAFSLSQYFNRKVVLDVSSVLQEYGKPEWLEYALEWEWAQVSTSPVVHLEIGELNKVNVGVANPKDFPPNSHFYGFNPSIRSLEESGLFQRGVFPFNKSKLTNLKRSQLALCVRRGDYHQNPHLGTLSGKYYKKAMAEISESLNNQEIVVFCDSREETERFLNANNIPFSKFDDHLSPLDALRELSASEYIIMANSTFSFWGSYFSNAHTFLPNPFYISEPGWGSKLSEGSTVIKYMRVPKVRYFCRLILRKLQS